MLADPGSAAKVLLGAVVPKRHARRSVTRTLLKRLIRAAASRRAAQELAPLPAGVWVVRLRAPFDRAHFVSAASDSLRSTARTELDALFGIAQRRLAAAVAR